MDLFEHLEPRAYLLAGALDPTFGLAGRTTTDFTASPTPSIDHATVTATQSDGKIIVAGVSRQGTAQAAVLARYKLDGSLDPSFGKAGRVRTAIDAPVQSIAILADGRMLIAADRSLSQLRPDGSPDPTFGLAGTLAPGRTIFAMEPLPNGKFLLITRTGNQDHELRRYLPTGELDPTFAVRGALPLPGLLVNRDTELAIGADGKIIIAGAVDSFDDLHRPWAVRRVNPNGTLDRAFGNAGTATADAGGRAFNTPFSLAIQKDGKIVLAGSPVSVTGRFTLVRWNANGTPDSSFGHRGVVSTSLPPESFDAFDIPTNQTMALALQNDGKIILVGRHNDHPSSADGNLFFLNTDFAVLRYNPDGSLDNTFGEFGTQLLDFGGFDVPQAALITADGKLLIAGDRAAPTNTDFALARLILTDPSPINAQLDRGILKITGTPASDKIRLKITTGQLSITGVARSFPLSAFSKIQIDALAGNDTIDASASTVPLTINAGQGNDTLLAGSANDLLNGNAGHDTLFGGKGNDTLHGNDGNDYLSGGPGQDQLFGDNGNDQLYARDTTPDTLDGGQGFDHATINRGDLLKNIESLFA